MAIPALSSAQITHRAHDIEKAARVARAAELAREGRVQWARHIATPPASVAPSEFANMTKQQRMEHARRLSERGSPPVRRDTLSARERLAESAADHASQVHKLHAADHPSRDERVVRAGLVARRSRPTGTA